MTFFYGCGKSKKDSSGGGGDGENSGDLLEEGADTDTKETNGDTKDNGDGGTLDGSFGTTTNSMRLLTPQELDAKTQKIFGQEWIVEMAVFSEEDPNGTAMMNGFDAFAGNLNGIDYDTLLEYSEVGSAIYISTHEKFCRELTDASFEDAASRATFFMAAAEGDTMGSNPTAIEDNLAQVYIKMFGQDITENATAWDEILSLYGDLEGSSAADRVNKHPLQLTVQSLCFSSPFVHTF
jgi:hypothetical protein